MEVQPKHIFDDEKNWTAAGIWKPPSGFDPQKYQKRLGQIFGLSPSGESICRVKWAWECQRWENVEWDDFGNAIKGEWRQKYRALTVEIGDDEYVDISPPRWVLEERFEPGQYARSWELTRYKTVTIDTPPILCRYCKSLDWINPYTSESIQVQCRFCQEMTIIPFIRKDMAGQAPREGWYNLLPVIGVVAKHETGNACCKRKMKEDKSVCWGEYKIPGEKELKILRRAVAERNKDPEANPHAELDEQALRHAKAWGLEAMGEAKVKSQREAKEMWTDEVNTHGLSIVPAEALRALKESGRRLPQKNWGKGKIIHV
jgi:hypothetical protein